MNNLRKTDTLRSLASMCDNNFSLDTRMALISFHNKSYSWITESTILFVEYFQLISQVLLFNLALSEESNPDSDSFTKSMISIIRILYPRGLIHFDGGNVSTITTLSLTLGILLLKYTLGCYIYLCASRNTRPQSFLAEIWRWVFKLQSRVIFLFFSAFWLDAIVLTDRSDNFLSGITDIAIILVCAFFIAVEFAFSIFLQIRYAYVLPTKNILSAKDNTLEIMTLTQKFALQLSEIVLYWWSSSADVWLLISVCLLFNIVKGVYYFRNLPLYHMRTLMYQGILITIMTALNIAYFIQLAIRAISENKSYDISNVIILWITIALLGIKIFHGYLNRIILGLIQDKRDTEKLSIHTVNIIKQFRKLKKVPGGFGRMNAWSYLVNETINGNIKKILNINSEFSSGFPLDIFSKEASNFMFAHYLENLLVKFPKSDLVRLYLLYYYAKKLKIYGVAIKMITDIKNRASSRLVLFNASLMLYDIQNITNSDNKDDVSGKIDLYTYVTSISIMAKLKTSMLQQAEKQMKVCEEIMTEVPDLSKIFDIAQQAAEHRQVTEKKFRLVLETIPDYYIQLYITWANYQLFVNHSVNEYRSFGRKYYERIKRYGKFFKKNKMVQQNIFQKNNAFIVFSAQKGDFGKILFCTRSIEKIFGGDIRSYIGNDFAVLFTSKTRNYYGTLMKSFTESTNGQKSVTNAFRAFIQHKDGHVVEVDFYIDIHPFVSQELCFSAIIRVVPANKEYLLVHQNGDVEGITRRLGRKLNLLKMEVFSKTGINIKEISEELNTANEAFNVVTMLEKNKAQDLDEDNITGPEGMERTKKNTRGQRMSTLSPNNQIQMDLEEAKRLHSLYSLEGKEVVLFSCKRSEEKGKVLLKNEVESYIYNCNISTSFYGSMLIKVFALEETEGNDHENLRAASPSPKKDYKNFNQPKNPSRKEQPKIMFKKETDLDCLSQEEDEKQVGWIDFTRLTLQSPQLMSSTSTEQKEFLTSAIQDAGSLVSPKPNPSVSSSSPKRNSINRLRNILKIISQPKELTNDESQESMESNSEDEKNVDVYRPEQSLGSQISRSSQPDNLLKAYKIALTISHSPKSFKVLFLFFYALMIAVTVSQFSLKNNLDLFLQNLELKKNILAQADYRDNLVINVHGYSNSLWQLGVRYMNGENTAALNASIKRFVTLLKDHLGKLDVANQDLLVSTNFLDYDTRKLMFMKDVRVYENFFDEPEDIVMNLTNFQAIDRLVETGAKAFSKATAYNFKNAKKEFLFLCRNAENDLLIKSAEISRILDNSLTSEREDTQQTIIISLILTLVFLGLVTVPLYYQIYKQYKTEKNNMIAFAKLDTQSVRTTLDRLNSFRQKIENEKSFEEKPSFDLNEYIVFNGAKPIVKPTGQKNKHFEAANSRGIFRKYSWHAWILTFFIIILASLVLWSNISAKNSVHFFYKKQAQLRFSGRMRSRTNLAAVVSEELLVRNGSSKIFNEWTPIQSLKSFDDMVNLKNEASLMLMEEDKTYDPIIADVLFNNGRCDLIEEGTRPQCDLVLKRGVLLNYLNLLTFYDQFIRGRMEKFNNMKNKTLSALLALRSQDITDLFGAPRLVLEGQSTVLFNRIQAAFENDLVDTTENRRTIFIIITSCLAILSLAAWFCLLDSLKEANNQFKKVIQTFPAHIVLSSYLLKRFLMRNSEGSLSSLQAH